MKKRSLTVEILQQEAKAFAEAESNHSEPTIYGTTDGKAVGTYLEHKFQEHLVQRYAYQTGNSAKGIDFPTLGVDIKVTSIDQPQSSSPFKSARQKIYGLGYSLLIFVYKKIDHRKTRTATLNILHVIFVDKLRTADFQMTTSLCQILENDGNEDDLTASMLDKRLPVDEIGARQIAQDLLKNKPEIGYLTISNALQWRLQYQRVINEAGQIFGVIRIK